MRLVIVGNSGSGKTTLARQLAARFNSLRLELDEIFWAPGEIAEAREPAAVIADLEVFLAHHPSWIVEGCYGELAGRAAERANALLLLDPGLEVCLANTEARPWEPEKYASAADQQQLLPALRDWVRAYYQRTDACSWAAHRSLFAAYPGRKLHLQSLDDAADRLATWLAQGQAA
ncbi:MAG: hypothetical protein RR784_01990 [Burkholderiaceae bacterium]